MENCLVKKYKAAVNNPNLPVLEIMQQITTDALTRGGNMTVSDAQKIALNHFFYEIGAVSENTLWSKVRTLMLPIIGNGNTYVVQDYRNTGSAIDTTYIQDKAGALALTSGSSNKTINFNASAPLKTISAKNTATIIALTNDSVFSGANAGFRGNDSNNKAVQRAFSLTAANTYGFIISDNTSGSEITPAKRFETNLTPVVVLANANNSGLSLKGVLGDGTEITSTSTDYGDYSSLTTSFTEAVYAARLTAGYDYGILIDFSEALTDAEVTKVLTAVKDLRTAFLPSA